MAAEATGKIGPDAKIAIPALTELLKDKIGHFAAAAAPALGSIGPDAKTAIPRHHELLEDDNEKTFGGPPPKPWIRSIPFCRPPPKVRLGNSSGTMNSTARSSTKPNGKSCPMRQQGRMVDAQGRLPGRQRPLGHQHAQGRRQLIDGCVRTKGKFEHSFGYYVARVQLQKQPGHWSAFWIMGDGVGKVGSGGRDGTEIDIYEKPWLDDRVQHTLHWDGYGKDHKSEGNVAKVPGVMDGWHTFGLWWKPDEYVFYVDGKETWRTKAGGVCQVPEYIKLSDEIGNWAATSRRPSCPTHSWWIMCGSTTWWRRSEALPWLANWKRAVGNHCYGTRNCSA